MLRGLISFAVAGIAVIVQIAVVDRIAFPGGTGPDVVLLTVAALALASGPLLGALIGFWAGLALDVAPPGSHFVGQNALVFCLIGYLCGLAADAPSNDGVPEQGHTALFEIMVIAAAAVCGEALAAGLGVMLSDPRVTWPAIRHVLPVAVVYDLLLCPFVLFAAAAALRLAGTPRRAEETGTSLRPAARPVGLPQSTPRLRLSERGKAEGLAGLPGPRRQALTRREPRLKMGHAGSLGAGSLGAAFIAGGAAPKVKFGPGHGEGSLGGSVLSGATALNAHLARTRLSSSRFGRSRMGRSLLGGSVFSRSPSLRTPLPSRRPALPGRSSFLGHSSFLGRSSFLDRAAPLGRSPALDRASALRGSSAFGRTSVRRRTAGRMRSAAGGPAAGYAPRVSRPGLLARLAAVLRLPARHQPRLRQRQPAFRRPVSGDSPGRGWLRRSPLRRGAMGRGWGTGRTPGLGLAPARLRMRRSRSKRSWRTGGYR
jgi:rod shape-determining protein MreD